MYSLVLIITSVVIVLNVISAKSNENAIPEEPESERIIRGLPAVRGQFPWAAALYFNDEYICTCTIISPTTVLTAAHCVNFDGDDLPAELFYAIANVNRSASSVRIEFASVMSNPDFTRDQFDNDIAVLKTLEPINFSNGVRPICIARPNTRATEYKFAIAMGWGNTNPNANETTLPDILQYTKQLIVKNIVCNLVNEGVNDDKLCATGFVTGICNGDSGGPLVHITLFRSPVVIGIASYINGRGGCGRIFPAVFTRVSSQYDFIMRTANDPSICSR